jgi:hypothetical protein
MIEEKLPLLQFVRAFVSNPLRRASSLRPVVWDPADLFLNYCRQPPATITAIRSRFITSPSVLIYIERSKPTKSGRSKPPLSRVSGTFKSRGQLRAGFLFFRIGRSKGRMVRV